MWAYVALAGLYAVNTPAWQVPDEPAHYNYVRTIAEQGALPVLQVGDYDQRYLEALKAAKFPPDMPIDSLRYEAHQPPLYYLLAVPAYRAGERSTVTTRLLGLRLQSVLWGTVLLAIIFRLATEIFPREGLLPVLSSTLAAFVPQHLAIAGGVNNDILAEVALAGAALLVGRAIAGTAGRHEWWWLAGLIGAGFLTKTTTYVAIALVAASVPISWWLARARTVASHANWRWAGRSLGIAFLIASPWFVRGAVTYGPTDWLGLGRHATVVAGQPRTLDLYPDYFAASFDWLTITFRSFWGQFGWMGVPLDGRIYAILAAFCLVATAGFAPAHFLLRGGDVRLRRAFVALLIAWFAGTLGASAYYSLEYFQAQGRYLYPAIGAISILLALGVGGWLAAADRWAERAGIASQAAGWVGVAVLMTALIALDLMCLYRFLVPALR